MKIIRTDVEGLVVLEPTPYADERGFFTRTLDVAVLAEAGIDPTAFVQESQSRSRRGVARGLHGRSGAGEAKLIRCAHGAVFDVAVDARPGSATFGAVRTFLLDDVDHRQVYLPRGFLHGQQPLTDTADLVYRIDSVHDPRDDVTVALHDPDLAIAWPVPVTTLSDRDRGGMSWADYRASLGR